MSDEELFADPDRCGDGKETPTYETIRVPTDGSESANRAIEHALDLAESYGAAVHTLHVVDTDRYGNRR